MAKRITRKQIENLVISLKALTGSTFAIDNAPVYGGYALTYGDGSAHVTHRMPPKEFVAYLRGALDFLTPVEG